MVQALLLGAVVLARTGHLEAQCVPVVTEAPLGVEHGEGRVVNAQKKGSWWREHPGVRAGLPARIALSRRKPDDLQGVAVGIREVEGLDAGGPLVPGRQGLRFARHVSDVVCVELAVGARHVRDHDGDVLEGLIVAAHVVRHRAAARRDVLGQHHGLSPQHQAGVAHPRARHTLEPFERGSRRAVVAGHGEREHVAVEGHRPIEIGHGDPHGADRVDRRRLLSDDRFGRRGAEHQRTEEQGRCDRADSRQGRPARRRAPPPRTRQRVAPGAASRVSSAVEQAFASGRKSHESLLGVCDPLRPARGAVTWPRRLEKESRRV